MSDTSEEAARLEERVTVKVARLEVAIASCRRDHTHNYGCERDGEPLNEPCEKCGDPQSCAHCERLRRDLELVNDLSAELATLRATQAAAQSKCPNCEKGMNPENAHCDECCPQAAQRQLVWQPIETAPKDGTQILVAFNGRRATARWDRGWSVCGWWTGDGSSIQHWMPLPEPPAVAAGSSCR